MLRESEAKAAVAHRSAPQRHRRTPSVLTKRAYGVGQYECSFTASGTEIELVDTVFPCVHMKVTDNASNIKKTFKFFDDEATNRKRK
jgi:hypothetical protein